MFSASSDFSIGLYYGKQYSEIKLCHPYFRQTFVFRIDSHQIILGGVVLCLNMKKFCPECVYFDCGMHCTHVVVWCDGRKEVWPAGVTHSEL